MGPDGRRVGLRAVGAAAALTLAATACASEGSSAPSAQPFKKATITVAQFNTDISDEFPTVPISRVAQAIRASRADVAGIEEGGASMPAIAKDLGWHYYSVRMQIVSRLPLIDPPSGNGVYLFVQVRPGQVVAMENVHLPASPYGPYWVRDGKSAEQVVAMERRIRLPAIQPGLVAARTLDARHIPVFLTGDFNSPSWHDWTRATVGTHKYLRYPVRWPVAAAVEAAGFHDSFRTVHPNPLTKPGYTWPVHRVLPGWNPTPRDPPDRIDFVFAAGRALPTASVIVGEPAGPELSAEVSPWPSDHRLVASTFSVTPSAPPTLVSVSQRLVPVGRPVEAVYHAPGGAGERVAIVPAGAPPRDAVASRDVGGKASSDGTADFSSASWTPGAYEAVLLKSGAVFSRFPFWVKAPETKPSIATSKVAYGYGEPIDVSWNDAPGERWDWVSVYRRGADPNVAPYLLWVYTHASVEGSTTLNGSANGKWPLAPGRYSVYLLKDDLYVKIASAAFTVKGR